MTHIHTPKEIPARYLGRSSTATLVFGGMFFIGLIGFIYGLMNDPNRAWQSYVANWLFFTGVAMGAVMFTVATTIVKARWNWSVKRVSLSFVAFLPLSLIHI